MRDVKESKIDIIGDISRNWDVIRLKYLCDIQTGDSDTQDANPDGEYPFYVRSPIVERSTNYTFDGEGILMAGDGAGAGRIFHHAYGKYAVHQRVYRLSNFKKIDSTLLFYYLQNLFCKQMDKGSAQSTVPSVRLPMLLNFNVCLPPIDEQERIANFLDEKCEQIDSLVADIQSQIDTLEEYKKSVITEAVTKGLNPDVEMKDSGVEWIVRIPRHWMVKRGKYNFVLKSEKGNTNSLVLLSPTQKYGVIPQELYEQYSGFTAVKLSESTNLNLLKTVHKGAFVISLRSFEGGFEYSEYEGVVSPAYQVFYPSVPMYDRYYKYLFKTPVFIDKMNSYAMSLRDGKNIAFSDFGRTYIPIPPMDEQQEIVEYLDNKCVDIDAIISEKKEQLSTLAEYKKSLIYEYVTGKKEVAAA